MVIDNGPTWTNFCKTVGINPTPVTNGLFERFVESFKTHLSKIPQSGHSIEYACNMFLFEYRSTVHKTAWRSPAKLVDGIES